MGELRAKQAQLQEVADRLAGLQAQLEAAKRRKAELEADVRASTFSTQSAFGLVACTAAAEREA